MRKNGNIYKEPSGKSSGMPEPPCCHPVTTGYVTRTAAYVPGSSVSASVTAWMMLCMNKGLYEDGGLYEEDMACIRIKVTRLRSVHLRTHIGDCGYMGLVALIDRSINQ